MAEIPKQAYRSELGTLRDILFAINDSGVQGIIVSALSRKTNLSHYAVLEKSQKLIDAGLAETMTAGRNRIYKITEKGVKFWSYMSKFDEEMKSFGLSDSVYKV